jgi:hypothetical protein
MVRLHVHVEGLTEERFVNSVLCPHLVRLGYSTVTAKLLGNARLRSRRGGINSWASARRDILNHLREDRSCLATTMVDFYGLPKAGQEAWPGRAGALTGSSEAKAALVERALQEDICAALDEDPARCRFVPFVVMHEFEGLLFSDCEVFGREIGHQEVVPDLQAIRDGFGSPEDINDSPTTCPSRRVAGLVPGYQKPLFGILAATAMGLDRIRRHCPHFADWLTRLENRAT